MTPLMTATRAGTPGCVELLLARGADFREPADDGVSPVSMAVRDGHADIVELFLERGSQAE